MKAAIVILPAFALALLASGCETISKVGTSIAVESGQISTEQAESINRTAKAVDKSAQDITPEQEYYIGRAVAAKILGTYAPYPEQISNDYLNKLGEALALYSDRPETFGGYHFLILETPTINAFAAPGGLILVSRGLLRCTQNEDETAAILAHEIGHVVKQHGLNAIKTSRLNEALTSAALTAGELAAPEETAKLTTAFGDSINDITSTLVNSGYSRAQESEADHQAVIILQRTGYDATAMVRMLEIMKKRLKPGGLDFAKTHPDPADRIKDVKGALKGYTPPAPPPPERLTRYQAALGKI
jgi:predicted Zn-dependent protease